jgi:predicted DCC family thiol-disulfide oxidoreductase YuxK
MAKRGFGRFIQEDLGPGSRRVRVAGGVRLPGFACSSAIARAGCKPVDRVLMGPTFGGFLLVFAFWIPWTAVAAALRNAWPARGRYAMLYDGTCGVCRRTVDIVQRLDVLGRVDVLDAARDWPSVERRYPMLSQAACLDEMHVLRPDGRRERGFDAYRLLARALPVTWVIVPTLYVPGVRWIGQALYKSVAHRRARHGCALSAAPPAPASGDRLPTS